VNSVWTLTKYGPIFTQIPLLYGMFLQHMEL